MCHTYRNIEPLNIEWCLTSWTILMCRNVYNFQICSKKKKLGSTSPSKHIFLISSLSRIPRSKIERKKMRKCVGKLHLLMTKLYTISLQNLTKKLTCKPWCFLTEFYRDFIARILKSTL